MTYNVWPSHYHLFVQHVNLRPNEKYKTLPVTISCQKLDRPLLVSVDLSSGKKSLNNLALPFCSDTSTGIITNAKTVSPGFMRHKSYKIQGFSKPFHSIIRGQFNALLPVDHSIAYSPTDTQGKRRTDLKHWCVIFISKTVWAVLLPALQQLRQFTQSSSLVETFTIDKFQTFQGLPLFFQYNSRPQFSEIQGLFEAGLEFKAGAGTLSYDINVILHKSLDASHWSLITWAQTDTRQNCKSTTQARCVKNLRACLRTQP